MQDINIKYRKNTFTNPQMPYIHTSEIAKICIFLLWGRRYFESAELNKTQSVFAQIVASSVRLEGNKWGNIGNVALYVALFVRLEGNKSLIPYVACLFVSQTIHSE